MESGPWVLAVFFLAFVVGMALRVFLIADQILLNDEWYAMAFVVDKPFLAVVSSMNQSANSVPLNIYFWLSLHFFG